MDNEKQIYERFKLQWMIDHGFTLADLIDELQELREEIDVDDVDVDMDLQSIFARWEFECGFGSEIWPCFDEFMDCDYKEFFKSIR